jgi:hypothetical protein
MSPVWAAWEDHAAGLYTNTSSSSNVQAAYELLVDTDRFYETAREMVRVWPHAAIHNLTYLPSGRISWLGQASCCYATGATSMDTRTAWGLMTNNQQRNANAVARRVRTEWEKEQHDGETLLGL